MFIFPVLRYAGAMRVTFTKDWDEARGARLVDFHGWLLPLSYAGVLEEHRAVRTRAGLFNISHMGRLSVFGPQARRLCQTAFTNDLSRIAPGDALYGFVLNERGGILDDVIVYKEADDRYLWIVNAANQEAVAAHLERIGVGLDAGVEDLGPQTALIALQGPASDGVLASLCEGVDPCALPYFSFARGKVAGVSCLVSATGYTGEDGFELLVPADEALRVWEALAGRPEVSPCGLGARDLLRLEAGLPLHGHDIGPQVQPREAGMDWAVRLDKEGGFFGREALLPDPPRRLIGLTLEGRNIPRAGYVVTAGGKPCGEVTSGAWSPVREAGIALALVAKESVDAELSVEVRGRAVPARRVKLPWVRNVRKKKRPGRI